MDDRRHELTATGMAVAYWAQVAPDRPAVISPHGARTFAELNARANRLVRGLRARGLGPGDPVAIMSRNRPEFVEVWAACLRAGWRLTPVNSHLTGEEAAYIVHDCEARVLVADASRGGTAAEAGEQVESLELRFAVAGDLPGFQPYEEALADDPTAESDIDDAVLGATMLYTSGTTGRPKGVHRKQPQPLPEIPRYDGERHRHLCTGPLYHAAPLVISLTMPVTNGVGVVLMDEWSPEETLRLVEQHRITHTHMVPTMFHRLLALPAEVRERYDVSSLKLVVHGAAACPVHVKRAMIDWFGPILTEYYSSTEGPGTIVDARTWLEHPGTVGRPENGAVFVGDADAAPLPTGEVGLVWITAPDDNPFDYFKDGDKTTSAYRGDAFTLGDLGYLDDDGFLYLTDRSADLVVSGGVNVYPAEVDAVLLEHPAVADAAVIGLPDDDWGEVVVAVIEPVAQQRPSDTLATEIVAFCRDRLAHFKCPRRVEFVDHLPRSAAGKVRRHQLRDRYRRTLAGG